MDSRGSKVPARTHTPEHFLFGDMNEGHPGHIMSQISHMWKQSRQYLYPKIFGSEWFLHVENKCL